MPDWEPDEDGLPRSVVGEWALEKHERLRRYIEIAWGARSSILVLLQLGITAVEQPSSICFVAPGVLGFAKPVKLSMGVCSSHSRRRPREWRPSQNYTWRTLSDSSVPQHHNGL